MRTIYLISYYFRPYKGVGALRMSYWFDRFKEDGFDVYAITATNGSSEKNVFHISKEDNKISNIIIKDESFVWGFKCIKYLSDIITKEDIVVLSGGPFLQFISIILLKIKIGFKLILDYRDPLSNNPRTQRTNKIFNYPIKTIKRIYEYFCNINADKIVTVNQYCKKIIIGRKDSEIIENGYDERYFNDYEVDKKYEFVYAGKLYEKCNISCFCSIFENIEGDMKFLYIGDGIINCKSHNFVNVGFKTYTETVKLLEESKIGLILLSGEEFESTTKVFDYFAAKLKILIITSGKTHTGNLNEIVKNNPNVEWATNDQESIKSAINRLDRDYIPWDYSIYSRDIGYKRLINIINNLTK